MLVALKAMGRLAPTSVPRAPRRRCHGHSDVIVATASSSGRNRRCRPVLAALIMPALRSGSPGLAARPATRERLRPSRLASRSGSSGLRCSRRRAATAASSARCARAGIGLVVVCSIYSATRPSPPIRWTVNRLGVLFGGCMFLTIGSVTVGVGGRHRRSRDRRDLLSGGRGLWIGFTGYIWLLANSQRQRRRRCLREPGPSPCSGLGIPRRADHAGHLVGSPSYRRRRPRDDGSNADAVPTPPSSSRWTSRRRTAPPARAMIAPATPTMLGQASAPDGAVPSARQRWGWHGGPADIRIGGVALV